MALGLGETSAFALFVRKPPWAEEMLAPSDADRATLAQRTVELALQLAEQYKGLLNHWSWGDSVLERIRQCEITFESRRALRSLLQPDVWPHAGRASFVTLLIEKRIPTPSVTIERAVGLRLTFRQPPPIGCCSSQFRLYLNSSVANTAFHTWSHLARPAPALLPPHRFHFEVLTTLGTTTLGTGDAGDGDAGDSLTRRR